MKKVFHLLLSLSLLLILTTGLVSAQQEAEVLRLGLTRNFGYGGLGKIQGNFTLKIVDPPADLAEVRFYLDDELMEEISEPPFQYKFSTGEYEDGEHQMSAQGVLADGRLMSSNTITKTFLSSEQAWGETQDTIFPLLLGVGALSLIGIGAPMLLGRKKEHVPGKYGPAGGAVCPRCELPFARPFLSPNMAVGKLVRCPHCGNISILPRAGSSRLLEAEKRFAGESSSQTESSGQDDIQKLIEDSRFVD